ncbi:MAG TPA: Gfo/Idh/MocA family oxidoreductase [bacterium]|nr:Gfo/Idh/MocA family oxidoreductase [bacterium]
MANIKTAVIGTGFIGPAHIEGIRRLGYVDVVALAEENDQVARQKADALCIPQAFGNYRDLLADKSIQAVHICTPNFLHYEMVKAALEAGKHVVSEKPLAMNSKESGELVAMAREKGLQNAVNFNYRFYPLVQEARQKIAAGEPGKVRLVHGSYLQDWLLFDTDWNWRLEPGVGGDSRAVADIGSHWCDLLTYITGQKIVEVYAKLDTIVPSRKKPKGRVETFTGSGTGDFEQVAIKTEDTASVMFKMFNGAVGNFMVSQVSPGRKNRLYFEIDCERMSFVWDQENPDSMWIGYRDKANQVLMRDGSLLSPQAAAFAHYPGGHPEGYPDLLKNFFDRFYAPIAKGTPIKTGELPPYADFAAGDYEVRVVEAILTSNKKQAWVSL